MLREHVSFAGEADVARRIANRRGQPGVLPQRLRLYLSQAWYFWRLALRRETLPGECQPQLDLSARVEDAIAELWPLLETQFVSGTAHRARAAGMKTDVQVVDGNAKNRRLVCAALLRHMITCPRLGRSVCVGCPRTPLLGSPFCAEHHTATEAVAVDYEIVNHEVPTGGFEVGRALQLFVRETRGRQGDLG